MADICALCLIEREQHDKSGRGGVHHFVSSCNSLPVAEPTDAMKEKAREWIMGHAFGVVPEPTWSSLAALLAQAEAEGAKKERAAMVAWLRRRASWALVRDVEQGDHLKGEDITRG